MNGYNFSERVRKVLALAREAASTRGDGYVGTEHILLGIIAEGEGVASAALVNLGIDASELKASVDALIPEGKSAATDPDLPYTSGAKKVLELAMSEARDLGHSYVGTEHVLIALMREERGIAAQALRTAGTGAGLELESVRTEVLRLLGTEMPANDSDRRAPIGERRPLHASTHAPSSPGNITGITLDVRFDDGSNVRGEFRDVEKAYRFLRKLMSS